MRVILLIAVAAAVVCSVFPVAAPAQTYKCPPPITITSGYIWYSPGKLKVESTFPHSRRPKAGTAALIVPFPEGPSVRLKIKEMNANPGDDHSPNAELTADWYVEFEDAAQTPLNQVPQSHDMFVSPPKEGQSDGERSRVVILYPPPGHDVKRVSPVGEGKLPSQIKPNMVDVALDVDGDEMPDAMLVLKCIEKGVRVDQIEPCNLVEHTSWLKVKGAWKRCDLVFD